MPRVYSVPYSLRNLMQLSSKHDACLEFLLGLPKAAVRRVCDACGVGRGEAQKEKRAFKAHPTIVHVHPSLRHSLSKAPCSAVHPAGFWSSTLGILPGPTHGRTPACVPAADKGDRPWWSTTPWSWSISAVRGGENDGCARRYSLMQGEDLRSA